MLDKCNGSCYWEPLLLPLKYYSYFYIHLSNLLSFIGTTIYTFFLLDFYYDKFNGSSSWATPYLLLKNTTHSYRRLLVQLYALYFLLDFYYDKLNGSSSWETPLLLMKKDHDKLEYKEDSKRKAYLWCLKNDCPR